MSTDIEKTKDKILNLIVKFFYFLKVPLYLFEREVGNLTKED